MAVNRREYAGGGVSTTTATALASTNASSVNVTLNATTGWPFGANKFFVVFEPGTANEEKVLVSRASSGDTAITVASDSDRGLDGTTAVTHASGATVYPVFTATDADEANELASMWEAKGDLVSHGASTFARLAVGSDDYVLTASSGASSGLAWGLVDTANIAADAITQAKIEAGAVDLTELATAVTNRLVPAGTVVATVKSSADTGWLLLDGSTITNASSAYPALWSAAPVSWQSGTSLVLPDMSDRMLEGAGGTTLGAVGGANSVTIAEGNLPTHVHVIDHNHAAFTSAGQSQSHTHSIAHDHAAFTSGGGGAHDHGGETFVAQNAGQVSLGTGFTVGTDTINAEANHTHSIDVPAFTGNSQNASQDHTHSIDVPAFTGNSGNGGFANSALTVTNAHLAVNFQIKAH